MVLFKIIERMLYGFGFGLGMSTAFSVFPKIENMTPEEYEDYKKKIFRGSKRFLKEVDSKLDDQEQDK
jgi:hypothetical protein